MRTKLVTTMILAGAVLVGGNAASASESAADWNMSLKVKLAMLEKLGKDSLHVEVDANAGALKLTGTVDKRETRELVETVANTVDGVKSIDNDVRLVASVKDPNKAGVAVGEAEMEVKDAMLSTKIRIALGDKMGSDGFKIGTEVANGVVTLEFAKDFATARRHEASKVVEAVAGVTKVISIEKA